MKMDERKVVADDDDGPSQKKAKLIAAGLNEEMANRISIAYTLIDAFEIAQKKGIKIYNATDGGYLDVFERVK